jgi:hypothetical protein
VGAVLDPGLDQDLGAAAGRRVDLAAHEVDGLDLADLDARDLDRRTLLQVAAVVVLDVDREAVLEREVAEDEHEADQDHGRDDDQQPDLELQASFAHRGGT